MNRFDIDKVYIVAEMSQNHNGDMELARQLIDEASIAGCSAVKGIKRDISHELTKEAYNREYKSKNRFAHTYGKHREFLEFSPEQHRTLRKCANDRGMDYILSVRDIPSLEFALTLDPPLLKLASIDITHIPLMEAMAKIDLPVAFSMGVATKKQLELAMSILMREDNIVVVCTSEYPTYLDNINLNRMNTYPAWKKGFSCHLPDPTLGIAAVAMGAKYIEYHITLDREMKGTDQPVSLELDEWVYMISAIKDLTVALGSGRIPKKLSQYLEKFRTKLKKKECEDGIWRIQ